MRREELRRLPRWDIYEEAKDLALTTRTPSDVLARRLAQSLTPADLLAYVIADIEARVRSERYRHETKLRDEARSRELKAERERQSAFEAQERERKAAYRAQDEAREQRLRAEKVRQSEAINSYLFGDWQELFQVSPAKALYQVHRLKQKFWYEITPPVPDWSKEEYFAWAEKAKKDGEYQKSNALDLGCPVILKSGTREGEPCGRTIAWEHLDIGSCTIHKKDYYSKKSKDSSQKNFREFLSRDFAWQVEQLYPEGGAFGLATAQFVKEVESRVRLELTEELLRDKFELDGRRVTWGAATVQQHQLALEKGLKSLAAEGTQAALHSLAIKKCEEAGVTRLNDVKEKAK